MNDNSLAPSKSKILITLGGGGHLFQAKSLIANLGTDLYDFTYVTTPDSLSINRSALPQGTIFTIPSIISSDTPFWKKMGRRALALIKSFYIIAKTKPDAVVCVASSISIPLLIAATCFRKKTAYIESITRVTTPSVTGKIVDRLGLCHKFYVQWPESVTFFRAAIYRGTVL
jgi:UDP-N-acetylglucosamine:LPS N-acetylglucosamine transferase